MSNITQRLDLRHSQNLVMTPQLQQAIKLLQLNNMELSQYVESELAQNPLLEKAEGDDNAAESAEAPEGPATQDQDSVQENFDEVWTGNEAQAPEHNPSADFDPGMQAVGAGGGGNTSFDDIENSFENKMSKVETLREHLTTQLHYAFSDPRDRMTGALLIDLIDESGYIRQGTEELATRLACPPARIENIMTRMKQFTPTGICAQTLKECLTLQLEEAGQCDAPMRILLDNLDLLAAHDHRALATKCGANETYLADMVAEIRALNPRPAAAFDHFIVQTAVPDALMKRLPKELGGGWRVELNSETLPRVLVNNVYYTEVSQKTKNKKDLKYLDEQLNAASWLVKALDQRAKTIIKVAGEIVERQEAFFLYGIEFLKPLTLRDIAEVIDMHESTVSRVTTGKYIGTPRGIFELKYFFSASLGEGDDAVAADAVKAKVKNLIDAEKPDEILSDDTLAEILKKEGIDIARRTIAKYREAMRIPSSVQRRKMKKSRAENA